VGVENQRVCSFHAAVAVRDRWVEHAERAVGAVDVEPELLRSRDIGERVERVDRARVYGPGRADEQRGQCALGAVGGDRRAQLAGVEPASLQRQLAHRTTADSK
jgi:hypothetical protein